MSEFNIGDTAWWAKYEYTSVNKTCPVCFGNRCVVVILGDNTQVQAECDYCNREFNSYGYIVEHEYITKTEEIKITGKEVSETSVGKEITYRHENYIFRDSDIYKTKEAAEKRAIEKKEKAEKEKLERLERGKNSHFKKYSWHVGYYQKKKRDALKDIEFCDRKIVYLKEKIKEGAK